MNSPQVIHVLYWLIADTFRQAFASRIFWIMLSVSLISTIFCLGVHIEGGERLTAEDDPFLAHPKTLEPLTGPRTDLGKVSLLFGAMRVDLPRDRTAAVEFLYVIFGTWVAGSAGVLLTLIWAAGVVPDFLHPSTASVLLTKPTPHWIILLGKFVGVVLVVALHAVLFFGGTWFALGCVTGVWKENYLAGAPIMVLHFSSLYAFTTLLGVMTWNTVASVLGSLLFWVACVLVNYGRIVVRVLDETPGTNAGLSPLSRGIAEFSYWVLPKPIDYLLLLERELNVQNHMMSLSSAPDMTNVLGAAWFNPVFCVAASALWCLAGLVLAGRQLSQIDY